MPTQLALAKDGFDVVVVGAGVVGLAMAERFARAGRTVLILEGEGGIARGITSRNSEVIHAGIYYPADSLKARACVEGRERLYAFCATHRVEHRRLGKLIVATKPSEESVLEDLLRRGHANGVDALCAVDGAEVQRMEPDVSVLAALHSPDTGIIDSHGLCLALLARAEAQGAVLALRRQVRGLSTRSYGWSIDVETSAGERESVDAGCVVDAAGLDADRVAELAGLPVDALGWRQHPCKGDYFKLAPGEAAKRAVAPSRLVYPVPQEAGLGIHLTLDLAGQVRFGPDTEYVSELDFTVDPEKADGFALAAAAYLPALAGASLVPDYAGIRPKRSAPGEGFRDFVVEEASAHGAPGLIACIGIESPGLTAALALAETIASDTSV